jgi:hypothetical protein
VCELCAPACLAAGLAACRRWVMVPSRSAVYRWRRPCFRSDAPLKTCGPMGREGGVPWGVRVGSHGVGAAWLKTMMDL